jgi:hypothetical protein
MIDVKMQMRRPTLKPAIFILFRLSLRTRYKTRAIAKNKGTKACNEIPRAGKASKPNG